MQIRTVCIVPKCRPYNWTYRDKEIQSWHLHIFAHRLTTRKQDSCKASTPPPFHVDGGPDAADTQ